MSYLRIRSQVHSEMGGATVRRLMPIKGGLMNHDPFVLWDHFSISGDEGFRRHPHRGFEAITYLFSGAIEHRDNLGNRSVVGAGGAQRFTAGRGIKHSEMPADDKQAEGIQLWINLPQTLKQIDPGYQQVNVDEFPFSHVDGVRQTLIVGDGSPLQLRTPVHYAELQLGSGTTYDYEIPAGWRGLVYVVSGHIELDEHFVGDGDAVLVEDCTTLTLAAIEHTHLMICFGAPHGEAIRQHGPYVD